MSQTPSDEDRKLWEEYLKAAQAMVEARRELFLKSGSLVELFRAGLHEPRTRPHALELVQYLKEEEQKDLFADVLSLASMVSGTTEAARNLILSMPREWVLANIEEAAEPLLHDGTYEEYTCLIKLYREIDLALAQKLAGRAAAYTDSEINEVGQDFLEETRAD